MANCRNPPEAVRIGMAHKHQERHADQKYGDPQRERADQTRTGVRSFEVMRTRYVVHRAGPARKMTPRASTDRNRKSSLVSFRNSTRKAPLKTGAFRLFRPRMGHIFSPAADTWLRLFFIGAVSLAVGSVVFAVGLAHSDWVTGAHIHPPAQPVPFSHRHHAGQLGIDCRYCHTSVAEGPRAGLPPTHTCMTCHSQIWTGAPMLAPVAQASPKINP